jgi:arylsulfatase A-like enzyme
VREDFARFIAAAKVVDDAAGIVLGALSEAGLDEETVVVFTTDHGIAFPHQKCTLSDGGIGVALALRYTGNPLAGRASDALVSHLDVYPTLCELAGLPTPPWLEGSSLQPLLEGRVSSVRAALFAEITYHAAYQPERCVRTDRHKLVRRWGTPAAVVAANVDDGPSKTFLVDHGWLQEPGPAEALFDLYLDPTEQCNRISDDRYAGVRGHLEGLLRAWMVATRDPLLESEPPPMPAGARINRPEAKSPVETDYL